MSQIHQNQKTTSQQPQAQPQSQKTIQTQQQVNKLKQPNLQPLEQLLTLQAQLIDNKSLAETVYILQRIRAVLQSLEYRNQVQNAKELIVKHLKPIVKQLIEVSMRPEWRSDMEALMSKVVSLYAQTIKEGLEVLGYEHLGGVLESNTGLFRVVETTQITDSFISTSSVINKQSNLQKELQPIQEKQEYNWVSKPTSAASAQYGRYTNFFYKCINNILEILQGIQQQFQVAGLYFIKQYLQFLYKLCLIGSTKLQKLRSTNKKALTSIQSLFMIIASQNLPANKHPKEHSYESLRNLSDAGVHLSNQLSQIDLKKRYDMLTSMYALSVLMGIQSSGGGTDRKIIDKKMSIIKMLNKQAEYFYRSSMSSIKQQQYVAWLYNNNVITYLFNQGLNNQSNQLVSSSPYIFRILFKRRCLTQQNFESLLDFVRNTTRQNRQFVLKNLELQSIRLEYGEYEVLIKKLGEQQLTKDWYEEDLFKICDQCIRYATFIQVKQFCEVLNKILMANFGKFRNQVLQYRCIKVYCKAFLRLIQKQLDLEDKKKQILGIYDIYFGINSLIKGAQNFQNQNDKKKDQFVNSCRITYIGIVIFKNFLQQCSQNSSISRSKVSTLILMQRNLVTSSLHSIKILKFLLQLPNQAPLIYSTLLPHIQQLCITLLKYIQHLYGSERIQFMANVFEQAVYSAPIMERLMGFVHINSGLLEVFEQLLAKFQVSNETNKRELSQQVKESEQKEEYQIGKSLQGQNKTTEKQQDGKKQVQQNLQSKQEQKIMSEKAQKQGIFQPPLPFESLKYIFVRMNSPNIREIKQPNQQARVELTCQASQLKGFESLKYLLLNANNEQIRDEIAMFIGQLYTGYADNRNFQGEEELAKFLKEVLFMTISEYKKFKQNPSQPATTLLGYLALVQSLLLSTQTLGCGQYRPHNSLVPISTVQVRIINDITYGNDVSQSYEKKVSSNLTLFQLLEEIKDKFRCPVYQICMKEGDKYWPQRWNGLTLEELKIDGKSLKAIKSTKQKIRKQKLMENDQLTIRAKKAFQQIYNTFAVDNKMGRKQCSNFVAAVTKTSSTIHDGRVQDFFKQHDIDNDQNLTLQDFYRFYKANCSPEHEQKVWKNLSNMRFRRDLRRYDDPIQLTNQNILFRALIYRTDQFYAILFSLLDPYEQNKEQKNQNNQVIFKELYQRSKRLLLRLPTYSKTLQNMKQDLKLIQKNCFQTEYLLVSIQSKLNASQSFSVGYQKIDNKQKQKAIQNQKRNNQREFIQSGNHLQIFQMMLRIDSMKNPTEDELNCLYISLQILRSLLRIPNLKGNIDVTDLCEEDGQLLPINVSLPQTYLFKKLAQQSFKRTQIDTLEASLALQLTQPATSHLTKQLSQFCLNNIFNQQLGIRKICCNIIFVLYAHGNLQTDLFNIQEKINCQYWFQILRKICEMGKRDKHNGLRLKMDYNQVITKCLDKLKNHQEKVEKNPDDPIIFGNLSIIYSILSNSSPQRAYKDITPQLTKIQQKVISVRNRKLIYSILSHQDQLFALKFISNLIDNVDHVKEIQPKKFYVGLKNLGSTCYMNSVLQVLYCVREFKKLILSLPNPLQSIYNLEQSLSFFELQKRIPQAQLKGKKIYDNTLYQLQKMYTYLMKSNKKYYNPEQFVLTIKKSGSDQPIDPKIQEDAHQFVGKFLDNIQKQVQKICKRQAEGKLKQKKSQQNIMQQSLTQERRSQQNVQNIEQKSQQDPKTKNILSKFRELLQGSTVTQIFCKKCQTKIFRQQKFSHITLPVKDLKTVQEGFQHYIKPEEIQDYFCGNCNGKVQKIEKSIYLNRLPKLLTINLQRITHDIQTFTLVKIDSRYQIPQKLNLSNYILKQKQNNNMGKGKYDFQQIQYRQQDLQYKLKAIIVHSGTSESGHYYSFINNDGDWYKFNDQTVTKVQYKDVLHESFGSSQSKQQWSDDLKFSTNAYMVFYQNITLSNQDLQENKVMTLNTPLVQHIQSQNTQFYRQLQIHQQSIYTFIIQIFDRYAPKDIEEKMNSAPYEENWNLDVNLEYYLAIYQYAVKLIKLSSVFYDVKSDIIFRVGQIVFKCFFLLPQQTYRYITSLNADQTLETLCLHPDQYIRNIQKCLLNKSIQVFVLYYQANFQTDQYGMVKLIQILDTLYAYLEDQRLNQNVNLHKSLFYFQFWRVCCEFVPIINDYLIRNQMITILIDKIMANDSPLLNEQDQVDSMVKKANQIISDNDVILCGGKQNKKENIMVQTQEKTAQSKSKQKSKPKRPQIPLTTGLLIVNLICCLVNRKKNLRNQIENKKNLADITYYQLTQKQRKLLSNPLFYSRMIQKRYDNGQMSSITTKMSYKDRDFSRDIACVYIKGLNNITFTETGLCILNHLKFYLTIEDQYTQQRIKWIFGIPQLRMGDQLVYGLTYEDQSLVYQYSSPLYFIKIQKDHFSPALSILYENNSTFNIFSVEGVFLILSLIQQSQKILHYILSIPPPTYMYRCYIDWIDKYLRNFRDSYTFSQIQTQVQGMSKYQYLNRLTQMYNSINEKIYKQGYEMPPNKHIIGRNKDLTARESVYLQNVYQMTLWQHLTYILPNQPALTQNKSLPKQLFKFANPVGFARYFTSIDHQKKHCIQNPKEEPNNFEQQFLARQLTVYTLQVDTKQLLRIQFKFNHFKQEIYVHRGKVYINFPYEEFQGALMEFLQVSVLGELIPEGKNGKDNDDWNNIPPEQYAQTDARRANTRRYRQKYPDQKQGIQVDRKKQEQQDKDLLNFYANQIDFQIECKLCTFLNPGNNKICEMCENSLD